MHKKLNIPVSQLLEVVKDKRMLELFSLRVYMLLTYKNATMFNASAERIGRLLKCDRSTAERLYNEALKSEWFSYNGRRNSLRALSMKSQTVRFARRGKRKGTPYRMDFCYCMEKQYMSLGELVKRLRGVIIMMIIVQATGKEPSYNGENVETCSYTMVYQMTFANALGLSHGAVCKLVKYLAKIKMLDKTAQVFTWIKEVKSDEDAVEFEQTRHCSLTKRTSVRYYRSAKVVSYKWYRPFGLGYSVSKDDAARFRHIMWTHEERTKNVA